MRQATESRARSDLWQSACAAARESLGRKRRGGGGDGCGEGGRGLCGAAICNGNASRGCGLCPMACGRCAPCVRLQGKREAKAAGEEGEGEGEGGSERRRREKRSLFHRFLCVVVCVCFVCVCVCVCVFFPSLPSFSPYPPLSLFLPFLPSLQSDPTIPARH